MCVTCKWDRDTVAPPPDDLRMVHLRMDIEDSDAPPRYGWLFLQWLEFLNSNNNSNKNVDPERKKQEQQARILAQQQEKVKSLKKRYQSRLKYHDDVKQVFDREIKRLEAMLAKKREEKVAEEARMQNDIVQIKEELDLEEVTLRSMLEQ